MASQADPESRVHTTGANQTSSSEVSLHDAVSKGLTETVAQLLDQGVPVDQTNDKGATALHLAILEGHVDTVRLVLARNANVEVPYLSIKPVHLAAMTLNPPMMEAVLQYKPSLESRVNGLTALLAAISTGNEGVVRLLLDAGADARAGVTGQVRTGESVLHEATACFKNSLVPLLIRHGADVNAASTNLCQTALHTAAGYGNTEAMAELIASGANIYAKLPDGRTALELAAQRGQIKATSVLLDHGMDPLAKLDGKPNAVYMSVVSGKTQLVEWFLDRYVDRMDRISKIDLVLGAASTNRIDILRILDGKGFPMTDLDKNGVSALLCAIHFKHNDAIIYMLRRGADPEPYIPKDPNSWVSKGPIDKEVIDLLQTAKRQRDLQPDAELFPEWRYRDEQSSHSFQAQLTATLLSVNATRRIEANQEPGGAFNCELCHDLDFRRGIPRNAEIVYYIGLEEMQSAASHCRGCCFLLDCLAQVRKAYGEKVWAMLYDRSLTLHSAAQGAPLLLHFHNKNPFYTPLRWIEIYVNNGGGATWPTVGTGRDVSVQGWGDARVSIAKNFLRECTTNHTHCHFTLGKLPTRVIQIPSTGEPHLYVSKGEKARYMTLSHCWGGISPLTTTRATLSQRLQEIPFTSLPKTFQDAVTITRSLGVEYLWIDSLCIIQDDRDDWTREAARMKAVYADCYAMISANGSANPNSGCFGSGISEQNRSFVVHSVGPFLSKVTAFVRLTQPRDTFHAEVGHIIGDTTGPLAGGQTRTTLNQRGWCLQERVLAPRILHLGPSELAWECPETVACECQCVITRHDRASRFKAAFADRILRDAERSRENQQTDAHRRVDILLWMHFVEEFTRRELTYSSDMLHALSGLAELMGAVAQTDYLCGLWKDNLAEFLLWHVDVPDKHLPDPSLMAPLPFRLAPRGQTQSMCGTGTGAGAPLAKRHATYHAPSWSWASVIGPISFDIGRLDMSRGDQLSHVRKDGMLEMARARYSLLEHVDAHYTTNPLNRFGAPNGPAPLTIRAPTIFASWIGKRSAADPGAKFKRGQILAYTSMSPGYTVTVTADFTPDPLGKEALGISIGDELLLLATIRDDEGGVPPKEYTSVYGIEKPIVIGLVLAFGTAFPVSGLLAQQTAERPVYRRVGRFGVNADDWSRVQSMRTVVIM